ncbi:exonuclease 1 [Cyprinodon tularosa]|nr:exonuclease 1 [Cyprinodon tularosa]
MGISGLLQFIKDAAEPVSIRKYKGQTVAVDTYCWLHKGAFSCAEKLAKGEPTDQYVWYCMKFVDMMLNFSVKPILVFDGRNLPSKQEVEKTRRERREANLQKGRQLLREGKLSEARDCFGRCVNITPTMAHNLIKAARQRGVDCVVAPYEADAQLAYLTKSGFAQAVITEDSDLLAFGCKTVILKMDKHGNGVEIDLNNLGRCRSLGDVFTQEKFRYMCILAGCDYLPSLHGIGLGKACKLLRLAKDPDILKVIRKMGQYLKMNLVVPDQYIEGFIRANNTFLYQLVFDPVRRKVVPLNPYPEHVDPASLSYAGTNVGEDKGLDLALGNLDINTMERIDDFSPDKPRPQSSSSKAPAGTSIWSRNFRAAAADGAPSTREQQRAAGGDHRRFQHREQLMKRRREESCLSDQEVLQQYSPSGSKRTKPEAGRPTVSSSQPRLRNCFASATLLQRRNEEEEEESGSQPTHSRFFSSWSPGSAERPSAEPLEPTVEGSSVGGSDGPDSPPAAAPGPPVSPGPSPPVSPAPAGRGLKLFQWSGGSHRCRAAQSPSGLAALQRFEYQRDVSSSLQKARSPSGGSAPSEMKSENKDNPPDSPPSQDSAYFSQSQRDEVLPCSFSPETSSEPGSPAPVTEATGKPALLGSKVSGLSRLKSSVRNQAAGSPMLGPARASGLRKKKSSSSNNENNPGVQATISSLWKNFSFKKEPVKMSSSKKPKPMSPVRDNLLIAQPT